MPTKKLFAIFYIILFFSLFFITQKVDAYTVSDVLTEIESTINAVSGVSIASTTIGDLAANIGDMAANVGNLGIDLAKYVGDLAQKLVDTSTNLALTLEKIAALLIVQTATQALIGNGGSGAIADWNNYLYLSPQQRAMTQMNSFFNTVSRGRLSRLNYEGVGPNYDAYLVAQARQAITGQPFTTNLQDLVTDPTQVFAGGNMKGLMTYMQCANNVACYTLTSTAQYNLEFTKAQEIAKNEQSNGFLPVKKGGKITQPASIAFNALSQIDQLGTQVIMNATAADSTAFPAASYQVLQGGLISFGARTFNYMTADSTGKAVIQDKNNQFPFSLAYSTNGGLGINAGGATVSTGVGAFNGNVQLGNTCATGNVTLIGGNAYVNINGQKVQCPANQNNTTFIKPSVSATTPSITSNGNTTGGQTISTP